MDFEIAEEHRMLKDLVANFVRDELMPLEAGVMAREADGKGLGVGAEDHARLDKIAHKLGLFGLDAPEDVGGSDLPNLKAEFNSAHHVSGTLSMGVRIR